MEERVKSALATKVAHRRWPDRPLRLLHTSDLHIGGTAAAPGCQAAERCLCKVDALVIAAEGNQPDAVLLPGDLFDHARVPEDLVLQVLARIADLSMPKLLLAGNHDTAGPASIFARHRDAFQKSGVAYVDGALTLFHGALRVWGCAMQEHTPANRPLRGAPTAPGGSWYVVMAHGQYIGAANAGRRAHSSPITAAEIASTKADYVALGHWHTQTDVSVGGVAAWYSGSPAEPWRWGEMLLVNLEPGSETAVRRLEVAPLISQQCR
jgi:exonuclease SbcD